MSSKLQHKHSIFNRKIIRPIYKNYELWEYKYFSKLFDLFIIFTDGIKLINPEHEPSVELFDNFIKFIFDTSTGYIDPYLKDNSETLGEMYCEFIIKRQKLYNKNES